MNNLVNRAELMESPFYKQATDPDLSEKDRLLNQRKVAEAAYNAALKELQRDYYDKAYPGLRAWLDVLGSIPSPNAEVCASFARRLQDGVHLNERQIAYALRLAR